MKSPRTAASIMVLLILFSFFFGGVRSVKAQSRAVERIFANGADGDGIGVSSDISTRIDASFNLLTIAHKYLSEDHPAVAGVIAARNMMLAAESITDLSEANIYLTEAATVLNEALISEHMTDSDISYRKGIMSELRSSNDRMSHDPYNTRAQKFNDLVRTFPANLFSKLSGTVQYPLFR